MTAHKSFELFFHALAPKAHPNLFTSWKGNVLRQGLPRWMSRPYRFTGMGSALYGGRWNVRRLMPAMYASTDPITLSEEVNHKRQEHGFDDKDFLPQLIIPMRWEFQKVVDLTNSTTLKALRVKRKEVFDCDWENEQEDGTEPVTQAIARAAFERLAEGLVVPSVRHSGGVNIVYFPCHRLDGTVVETLKPEELPPDMHGLD